ncbi:ABC transporter permease [Actinocrinis puniceicyclus]|uniref:ABC transporter permease n=1 Tax=Actinocrinis puniceicyclus TaxID=977794 RepID=A0A8J8BAP1_9ACTN|nr:ABC transporter permease [Actinocrinis puniceicyclus]MBS2961600.1 ABC transporter permease [Actinocrinis puniceicyclus]
MSTMETPAPIGSAAHPAGRPGAARLGYRQFRYWITFTRRTWRSGLLSAICGPALYLTAMGVGLGTLVDHGNGLPGGVRYLDFVAPGVLAATAMQNAFGLGTYPVLGSVKWFGNYRAAINTPQRPQDVVAGHAALSLLWCAGVTGIFFAFMSGFGTVHAGVGLLAWPASVLTAAAFLMPIMAYVVTLEDEQKLNTLFRFVMTPLFLFSGTFFPWRQLPGWAHPIAYATPLWHGVELCRSLTLGTAAWAGSLVHVAYLLAFAVGGYLAARITYRRRLYR